MTRILLFIKHRLPIMWRFIDWVNATLFSLFHKGKVVDEAERCLQEYKLEGYTFRQLDVDDLGGLFELIHRQGNGRLDHFRPHEFDQDSLVSVFRNPSFLMFGVFCDEGIVGYFFLRCFWNKRSFVGRLIDEPHERRGIGRIMNQILYNTAWGSGFRCHTTVSKDNAMVMRSHGRNSSVRVLGELPGNYLFIEFLPPGSDDQ